MSFAAADQIDLVRHQNHGDLFVVKMVILLKLNHPACDILVSGDASDIVHQKNGIGVGIEGSLLGSDKSVSS